MVECSRCECANCQAERELLRLMLAYLRHEHMRRRDIIASEQEITARFTKLLQPEWDRLHKAEIPVPMAG